MSGIQKLLIGGKEIVYADFSDCKEDEIIALATELSNLALAENKPARSLMKFNDKNYFTPKVVRHFETTTRRTLHLIDKLAIVGLSPIKQTILKGHNLIFRRDFKAFNSNEEAIHYLIDETHKY